MTEEIRTTSVTGGQKGVKAQRHSLLPRHGLDVIAEVFGFGAQKYEDHNWRRGYEWSKSYDALQRHLTAWWDGEDIDPESGLSHLGHAGFHILVLATWERLDGQGSRFDDRHTFNRPEEVLDLGYTTPEALAEDAGFMSVDWKDPEPRTLTETEEALQKLVEMALTPPRYVSIPTPDPEVIREAVSEFRASDLWTIPQHGEFDVVDLTPHQELLRDYAQRINEAHERVARRVARKATRFSVDIVGVTTDLNDVEEDWGPATRARLQEFFNTRG